MPAETVFEARKTLAASSRAEEIVMAQDIDF